MVDDKHNGGRRINAYCRDWRVLDIVSTHISQAAASAGVCWCMETPNGQTKHRTAVNYTVILEP